MVALVGPRIRLREHTADDLDAMHAWLGDRRVMRFVSFGTSRIDETRAHLTSCIAEQARPLAERRQFFLALVLRETDRVIGDAGLERRGASGAEASLGYFLQVPFWGRGYASEAARLLVDFGFEELGLDVIRASCRAGNSASERVMQQCALRRERAEPGRLHYAIRRREWVAPG